MNAIESDQILTLLESLSRPSFPAELAHVLRATLDVDAVRIEAHGEEVERRSTIAELTGDRMLPLLDWPREATGDATQPWRQEYSLDAGTDGDEVAPARVRAFGAIIGEAARARVVLTVAWLRRDGGFETPDATVFVRLLPLIRSLWQAHARGLAVEAERNALFESIGQRGLGAITLDRRAAPISISRRAAELMHASGAIGFTPSRLVIQDPMQATQMREAIAALLDDLRAGRRAVSRCVTLSDCERGSALRVQLCPSGAGLPTDAARTPAMVAVIEDLRRDLRPEVREHAARYALTAVETELVCRLVQGCTLERAAAEQRISIHTARKYLQQIFAKTQTCRQADLMRLLISGSPPPSPTMDPGMRAVPTHGPRRTPTLQPGDAPQRRIAR